MTDQALDRGAKSIFSTIKEKVSGGSYFWEALTMYPKVFPKLYIALIRAGESSGSIDQMLKRLARYIEDSERTRKILKSAMSYPIVVITIGGAVIAGMLVFIIPKFEDMIKSSGGELPLPTQYVINASHFLVNNIQYIIGIGGVGGYLILHYLKTPEGRAVLDRVLFKLPLIGGMQQKAGIARFARTKR